MRFDVGQIVRVPAHSGGFRVWQVKAVLLGGENQESVVELVTLDRTASPNGKLLVPCELLENGVFADGSELR